MTKKVFWIVVVCLVLGLSLQIRAQEQTDKPAPAATPAQPTLEQRLATVIGRLEQRLATLENAQRAAVPVDKSGGFKALKESIEARCQEVGGKWAVLAPAGTQKDTTTVYVGCVGK